MAIKSDIVSRDSQSSCIKHASASGAKRSAGFFKATKEVTEEYHTRHARLERSKQAMEDFVVNGILELSG